MLTPMFSLLTIVFGLFLPPSVHANLCTQVFKKAVYKELPALNPFPELQEQVYKTTNNPHFPPLIRAAVQNILKKPEQLKIVLLTRPQAREVHFPEDATAYFAAAQKIDRFQGIKQRGQDYNSTHALDLKILNRLGRDPNKHFIIIVKPNHPTLSMASQVSSLIHELGHLFFAEMLAKDSFQFKRSFPGLNYNYLGDKAIFERSTLDYLDEVFATTLEYASSKAIGETFNANWQQIVFHIEKAHPQPVSFLSDWVSKEYNISPLTQRRINLRGLEHFIEVSLNSLINE